jgi:regulator of protease activity HflC (stomatin/prohibitin superfamily)
MEDAMKVLFGLILLGMVAAGGCIGCPQYLVYHQRMEGEAELAKAEYTKKVLVQDAIARKESATALAEAEVIRANGVAAANKIIGDSLKNNEEYLRYMWIRGLEEGRNEVIYVPTEANLPILEAGRRVAIEKTAK